MGCYGIGVSRLIAAIVETHHDAAGIIWPKEIAPFDLEILPVQVKEADVMDLANKFYDELKGAGIDVLIDDRDISAGVKFNDADLIGIPFRLTVGKKMVAQNKVEIKNRLTNEVVAVDIADAKEKVINLLRGNK